MFFSYTPRKLTWNLEMYGFQLGISPTMTTDDSTSKGRSPADIKVKVATIKETPNPRGGEPSPPNRRPTTGPKFGARRPSGSPTNPAKISLGQRKGTQEIEASRKPNATWSSNLTMDAMRNLFSGNSPPRGGVSAEDANDTLQPIGGQFEGAPGFPNFFTTLKYGLYLSAWVHL